MAERKGTFAGVEDRLGAVEQQLAALIERIDAFKAAENETKTQALARIMALEILMRGNGKPGIAERVNNLERDAGERADERKRLKAALYGVFGAIVVQVTLLLADLLKRTQVG